MRRRMNGTTFLLLAVLLACGTCALRSSEAGDESRDEKDAPDPLEEIVPEKFGRGHTAILHALASRSAGYPDVQDEAERFHQQVLAGDWEAVTKYLAAHPPEMARGLFARLLRSLGDGSVLLPGEVLDLAEAAPGGALGESELELLGALLARSLNTVNQTRGLLERLRAGTRQFGGPAPEGRARAAALLMAAGRMADAASFLPPLEPARLSGNSEVLLLHLGCLKAQAERAEDDSTWEQAWDLAVEILERKDLPEDRRTQALRHLVDVAPNVPKERTSPWLRSIFEHRPLAGMQFLSLAGRTTEAALRSSSIEDRIEALQFQAYACQELLQAPGGDSPLWAPALNVLALFWLEEAELGQRRGTWGREGNGVDPNDLLPLAPGEAWLARLDPSAAGRLRRIIAEFVCRHGQPERALELIALLSRDEPKTANELAGNLLEGWAERLSPNEDDPYRRARFRQSEAGTVPLTRARQTRNLDELARIVGVLRKLPIGPLDTRTLNRAFAACHSPAEVFREEDLHRVFGEVETLPAPVLFELIQSMRERLAGPWRAREVHDAAGTRREDPEIDAELRRGYQLAGRLLDDARKRWPGEWKVTLAQGAVCFDYGEYLYGQEVELAQYTRMRDQAFESLRAAAQEYGARLSADSTETSILPYWLWFSFALGSSDLSYLTRQHEPERSQLELLGEALRALPRPAAELHLDLFARQILYELREVPGELKARFLREGLKVAGERPDSAPARKLLDAWTELLHEIRFEVLLDGDARIGHGRLFGAQLVLRYTSALGRESGSFARYLQNNVQSGYHRSPVQYRNDLEKAVREALEPGFEIEALQFHAPTVAPRGFGREGWLETPLAYLALKAKDPAVDRIPVLTVDLDFNDGQQGVVILPLPSAPVLVDARLASPPPRPYRDLEVEQTLDARDLLDGSARLLVTAKGRGVLPEVEEVVNLACPGFERVALKDEGLSIVSLDESGERIWPLAERRWRIEFRPLGGSLPGEFVFPESLLPSAAMSNRYYVDADLVDAGARVALLAPPLSPWRTWLWIVALCLLGLGGLAWGVRYVRRRFASAPRPRYQRPGQLTAFTALALLRRIHADRTLPLDEVHRRDLGEAVAALEKRYFAQDGEAEGSAELGALVDRWVSVTR